MFEPSVVIPLVAFATAAIKAALHLQGLLAKRAPASQEQEYIVITTILNGDAKAMAMEFRRMKALPRGDES